jgi:hypothetical protein
MDYDQGGDPTEFFAGIEEATGDRGGDDSETVLNPEDRPRGIISKTDREYLCGLKEYAQPQTDANRRQAIRERVINGLEDFALLFLFLEDDEREKVFEELGDEKTEEVIASMAAFAYLGVDQERPRFEQCLERGILQAANRNKLFRSTGRATDADVSINVEYNPDPDKLAREFKQGKKLTDAEIGLLVRSGKIYGEDIEELQDEERAFPGVSPGSRHQ